MAEEAKGAEAEGRLQSRLRASWVHLLAAAAFLALGIVALLVRGRIGLAVVCFVFVLVILERVCLDVYRASDRNS